jgi:hypothetical protein
MIFETTDFRTEKSLAVKSKYPKGGVSFFKDSWVVKQTLFFQIKFCIKSIVLREDANLYI